VIAVHRRSLSPRRTNVRTRVRIPSLSPTASITLDLADAVDAVDALAVAEGLDQHVKVHITSAA
jgi:hypothetical protein